MCSFSSGDFTAFSLASVCRRLDHDVLPAAPHQQQHAGLFAECGAAAVVHTWVLCWIRVRCGNVDPDESRGVPPQK